MNYWQKMLGVFVVTGGLVVVGALGATQVAAADQAAVSQTTDAKVSQTTTPELARQATVFLDETSAAKSSAVAVPSFVAEAVVLMDADTGRVLVSCNENKRMHPASTTKMVTLLTALKLQGTRLDELATISPYAASMEESNLGVKPTDQLPLQAVAEGMMVASGNDAAVVVAENVSGSVYRFALEMNQVAKEAGATGSHFLNPHGLTEVGHYSTALDLAKIAAYGMNIPMFRDFVGDDFYKVPYENRKPVWVRTTNHFIRSKYEGANGLETGYTEAAGECLIATATRDGHTLIVVLLNDDNRWVDAPALLDYGFARLGVTK